MSNDSKEERLAATPLQVTLYSRPGCHLCEDVKVAIKPLLEEFNAHLREVNVDLDPILTARYGWDIPVIFIGTHRVAKHRVDLAQFRRQLQQAQLNA
jgi:glutaredoxin